MRGHFRFHTLSNGMNKTYCDPVFTRHPDGTITVSGIIPGTYTVISQQLWQDSQDLIEAYYQPCQLFVTDYLATTGQIEVWISNY